MIDQEPCCAVQLFGPMASRVCFLAHSLESRQAAAGSPRLRGTSCRTKVGGLLGVVRTAVHSQDPWRAAITEQNNPILFDSRLSTE